MTSSARSTPAGAGRPSPATAAPSATATTVADPVEERPPFGRLITLGLQHVLVMYAGAIAVPLIIGRALKLAPDQVAMLISADLLCCGLATLAQSFGIGKYFGTRLPVMMGVTFAAVGPMLAMANDPGLGAPGIFGSVIGAGIVAMLIAPFISRMLALFPPVVTGSIILVIGVSLMRVGITWAVGGAALQPMIPDPAVAAIAGTAPKLIPNPAYAAPFKLGIALLVLLVILAVTRFAKGFLSNIAVLAGIVVGTLVTWLIGATDFSRVASAPLFQLVKPFQFGWPVFDPVAIVTMSLVMVVVMIESTGMFLALADLTGRPLTRQTLTNGLRTDGLGTLIGGLFNTFPYTSFSQNVGLVGVTGVRSRWVCVAGGVILVVMSLMPVLGKIAEAVPEFVLGGAGIVMFGMVAATGLRILASIDFQKRRHDLFIIAISLGFGMIPLVAPNFFVHFPKALSPLLHSGILLTALVAVVLNLYFNGLGDADEAEAMMRQAAHKAEAG